MKKCFALTRTFGMLALGATVALPLVFFAVPASAGTGTGTLTVQATVNASCSVSDGTLNFGTYDPTAGADNSSSSVNVTCTNGTGFSVAMGDGKNGTSDTTRAMDDGNGHTLGYQLYTDTNRANVWVSTCSQTPANPAPSATDCDYGVGNGSASSVTVYGQIPAGQYVTAGSYTDSVTMTVNF